MKTIVATTSVGSVGATFVDWSINYLSGQKTCYKFKSGHYEDLTHSPLTSINSHGHDKNYSQGAVNAKIYIDQFLQEPGELFTFYPGLASTYKISKELGIDTTSLTSDQHNQVTRLIYQDLGQIIQHCFKNQVRLIYIDLDPSLVMYTNLNIRSLERMAYSDQVPSNEAEVKNHTQQLFFKQSIETWQDLGLVNSWDVRERMALDTRPLNFTEHNYLTSQLNLTEPHCWVDCRRLWHQGEKVLREILDFCGLILNHSRLINWIPIYHEWQQQQLKLVDFVYNYQHIVDAIINNWDYNINNLTFEQEVVIQHLLIYKHGLNLKTWQLDKFPSNTKALHKLLEPCSHLTDSIY
jgi:hypothetical protein